jgi:hypothetical protein
VVRVQVVQVVLAPDLVRAQVAAPVVAVQVEAVQVLAQVVAVQVLAQVVVAQVEAVLAPVVSVALPERSHVPVAVVSLKNCSRNSRRTQRRTHRFQREQLLLSAVCLHRSLLQN